MDLSNITGQLSNVVNVVGKISVAKQTASAFFNKTSSKATPKDVNTELGPFKTNNVVVSNDAFSILGFTSKLKRDGFRLTKGYYYQIELYVADNNVPFTFMCDKVTLPGWHMRTQEGKIYGLKYETVTGLEQDPVWMTFNVDIMHTIEEYFLYKRKIMTIDKSYSPYYKDKYAFNMTITVTDENFVPVNEYILENAFVKTVQNVQYGAGDSEIKQVTIEVIYETVIVNNVSSGNEREGNNIQPSQTRIEALATPAIRTLNNKNQIKVGPFSADISNVNLVKDALNKVPAWFNGSSKII
jgi:hypothetical protein